MYTDLFWDSIGRASPTRRYPSCYLKQYPERRSHETRVSRPIMRDVVVDKT